MTVAVQETMMESMHPYLQELSDLALPAGEEAADRPNDRIHLKVISERLA